MEEINIEIESHYSKIQVLNVNVKIMQGEINKIEIKLPSLEELTEGNLCVRLPISVMSFSRAVGASE